jgi:uncharacterized LabA/DUF88 family protein
MLRLAGMAGIFIFQRSVMTRVAVFIDYQNVYMGARRCFADLRVHFTGGQVHPLSVGALLVERGRAVDPLRQLVSVRVFRGVPSSEHAPQAHAACQRQVQVWAETELLQPATRPLQYRSVGREAGVERFQASEKGIDVLLALGIALGAEHDEYDVCVLFSADSDLLPALEHARSLGKRVEVAAWRPQLGYASRLALPGIWCHYLGRDDYEMVADPTDYTR